MSTLHEDLSITSCGFYVSVKYPFLGASPDALIDCKCCGQGVVKVNCPLCAWESSLTEAARGSQNFCLQQCSDGKYELKHEHDYYYQCQLQMFVTNHSFCDFIHVVWTEKELHIECLALDDALIRSALPTAKKFFNMCILPELLGSGTRPTKANDEPQESEDNGLWCHCKEKKGGDMAGMPTSQVKKS